MKLRCRIGFHKWGKWTEKQVGLNSNSRRTVIRAQERVCKDCYKAEVRKVTL